MAPRCRRPRWRNRRNHAEAVAAGAFFFELDRVTFGLGLEAGLESARSFAPPEGTHWAAQRGLTLAATLGVRGWQIEAGARSANPGFTDTRIETNLFGLGAALTLGVEVEAGPVVLLVGPQVSDVFEWTPASRYPCVR